MAARKIRNPKQASSPATASDDHPPPPTRRRRSFQFALITVALSVVFTLLAAELGLRRYEAGGWRDFFWGLFAGGSVTFPDLGQEGWVLADPELGYRLNPANPTTSSLGLKNPEIEIRKPSGVKRLIVVGDSVTADPNGYVAIMRDQLAGQYEVINAGVPGYTTYQERLFLERDLLALEPDIVVLQYCLNDNHRFLHRFGPEGRLLITEEARRALLPETGDPLAWLPRWSRLAASLRIALLRWKTSGGRPHWERYPDFAPAWRDSSWPDFRDQLAAMRAAVDDAGARLTVIAPPYVPQLDPRLPPGSQAYVFKPQAHLASICADLEIPLLDLHPVYVQQGSRKLYRDILHFNEAGHRVTAEAVQRHLVGLGWIEPGRGGNPGG